MAEIKSANLPVAERIDLSCSGGKTNNIFRASHGGTGQNGEPAQADKLLPVARAKDVKLVMLSIGGNDLGFAGIIQACLEDYEAKTGPCQPSQQKKIDSLKSKTTANVGKAIDEIRSVMSEAGYATNDYRLIVQTYPSVVPRAAENRYPESGPERTANGCPLYDHDSNWARDRPRRRSARWSRPEPTRGGSRPSPSSMPSRVTSSAPRATPRARRLPAYRGRR